MIQTIIFSKNRAAQLDLLLRSLNRLAGILSNVTVLYICSTTEHIRGYHLCKHQHKQVNFIRETAFQEQTMDLLREGIQPHVTFLCDDDVVTKPWPFHQNDHPGYVLDANSRILCVSLRLGLNTTNCYPLRKKQGHPCWVKQTQGARYWVWAEGEGDWGYPGSLDGHIFERNMLRILLAGSEFTGPNELEDQLSIACAKLWKEYPVMACYDESVITGVPVNIVNTTHQENRNGEKTPKNVEELNRMYLKGKRLNLGTIRSKDVTAAHTELELVFT